MSTTIIRKEDCECSHMSSCGKLEIPEYYKNAKNIIIPEGTTKIGRYAFADCKILTSIIIPETVMEIEACAFHSCCNLKFINIEYQDSKSVNIEYQDSKNSSLPYSITKIGERAFFRCFKLTTIEIPNSVEKIERFAFSRCYNLTSIAIPKSVKEIGDGAFSYCRNLKDVVIPRKFYNKRKEIFDNIDNINFTYTVNQTDLKTRLVKQFVELRKKEIPKPDLEKLTYEQLIELNEKYKKLNELIESL